MSTVKLWKKHPELFENGTPEPTVSVKKIPKRNYEHPFWKYYEIYFDDELVGELTCEPKNFDKLMGNI